MAAPQLNLRVAPSGPLAGPGGSNPLLEMAGILFWEDGDASYRNAIGASNAAAADLGISYYRGDGPSYSGTSYNTQALSPQGAAFGLTAGVWRVRASLVCGFSTDIPTVMSYGALFGNFAALRADGTPAASANFGPTPIPKDLTIGDGPNESLGGIAHEVTVDAFLTITQAMLQSNGNDPLPGLALNIARQSSTSAAGPYDTNSGILEFTNDAKLFVCRYR